MDPSESPDRLELYAHGPWHPKAQGYVCTKRLQLDLPISLASCSFMESVGFK